MDQKPSPNNQRARMQVIFSLILGVGSLLLFRSGWYSILGLILGIIGIVLHRKAKKNYVWLSLRKQGVFRVCLLFCLCGIALNSIVLIVQLLQLGISL